MCIIITFFANNSQAAESEECNASSNAEDETTGWNERVRVRSVKDSRFLAISHCYARNSVGGGYCFRTGSWARNKRGDRPTLSRQSERVCVWSWETYPKSHDRKDASVLIEHKKNREAS